MKVLAFVLAAWHIAVALREERNASGRSLDPRIFGGGRAPEGKFPYMVYLCVNLPDGRVKGCSASLITAEWVLSAAHCLPRDTSPKDILLVAGKADLEMYMNARGVARGEFNKSSGEFFQVQERWATEFRTCPRYDDGNYEHDIALVKVEPFVLGPNVQTVPLSYERIKSRILCTILGWGLTLTGTSNNKLNFAEDVLVSTADIFCKKKEGPFVCLVQDGRGICVGDSGGPLVCDGRVRGVASHMLGNGSCGHSEEEYYAELFHDSKWVESVLNAGRPSREAPPASLLGGLLLVLWASLRVSPTV